MTVNSLSQEHFQLTRILTNHSHATSQWRKYEKIDLPILPSDFFGSLGAAIQSATLQHTLTSHRPRKCCWGQWFPDKRKSSEKQQRPDWLVFFWVCDSIAWIASPEAYEGWFKEMSLIIIIIIIVVTIRGTFLGTITLFVIIFLLWCFLHLPPPSL